MTQRPRPTFATLILAASLTVAISSGVQAQDAGTRKIMDQVFESLTYLLPLSTDIERFADAENRVDALMQIDRLAAAAEALEEHGAGRDLEFRLLSQTMVDDLHEIQYYFQANQPVEASYYLSSITQTCVACHSRLPSAGEFPFAEKLLARMNVDQLPPEYRAELEIATRQFETARKTYEDYFTDTGIDPVEFDAAGDLMSYLALSIRVLNDVVRPRWSLEKFLERPDVPFYLRRYIGQWLADMVAIEPELLTTPTLALGRTLFNRSNEMSDFAAGRERAIFDLATSSVLYRYLDGDTGKSATELAEAYYMLGIIEARNVGQLGFIPRVELLLEAAIRSDPQGPFAMQSYALLQEFVIFGGASPVWLDKTEALGELIGVPKAEATTR